MLSTVTGDEAKRAHEALGASRTAVAAAIGVNRTYYSLFESGRLSLRSPRVHAPLHECHRGERSPRQPCPVHCRTWHAQ